VALGTTSGGIVGTAADCAVATPATVFDGTGLSVAAPALESASGCPRDV
jgi:hypothetical protein